MISCLNSLGLNWNLGKWRYLWTALIAIIDAAKRSRRLDPSDRASAPSAARELGYLRHYLSLIEHPQHANRIKEFVSNIGYASASNRPKVESIEVKIFGLCNTYLL